MSKRLPGRAWPTQDWVIGNGSYDPLDFASGDSDVTVVNGAQTPAFEVNSPGVDMLMNVDTGKKIDMAMASRNEDKTEVTHDYGSLSYVGKED